MADADDILDNLSDEEEETLYTKNTDIEEHIVVGLDRFISVPDMLQRIAVQYDNKVETVTFDCPRYWDEHDLSSMYIYVNYMRSDTIKGRNLCKNIRIDEENPDLIHFEWKICNDITEVPGKLAFLLCAMTTNEDGIEDLHWNSEINTEMYVSEGLESEDSELAQYSDLINDLLTRMDNLLAADSPILDRSLTLEGFAAESKAVGDALRRFESMLQIEHFSQRFKYLYITKEANEDRFDLGEWYVEGCIFDVRVNGFDLNETEYTIDLENNQVVLTKPLDVIGTPVEVVITRDISIKSVSTFEKLRGPQGKGIKEIVLDKNYDIIITMEDDEEKNVGNLHTVKDMKVQNGQLTVYYTDGSEETIGDLYDEWFANRVIEGLYIKLDADKIREEYEKSFEDWFNELKVNLDDNAAVNLENQILELRKNEIVLSKDEPNRECMWYQIISGDYNEDELGLYVETTEYDETKKYSLEENSNLETITNMTDDKSDEENIISDEENN